MSANIDVDIDTVYVEFRDDSTNIQAGSGADKRIEVTIEDEIDAADKAADLRRVADELEEDGASNFTIWTED